MGDRKWCFRYSQSSLLLSVFCELIHDPPTQATEYLPRQVCIQASQILSFLLLQSECVPSSIDHHWSDPVFATASNLVQIWDETK